MRSKDWAPLGGAVIAMLMASAAWADADGWYVAIDGGGHKDYSTQAESEFVKQNGSTAKWRFRTQNDWAGFARIGYRFNPNWRAELEGGYRNGNIDYIHGNRVVQGTGPAGAPADYGQPTAVCATTSPENVCDTPAGYANNYSVMFNVIYDFFPQWALHPFVGAGIGADKLNISVSGKFNDVQNTCTGECPPGTTMAEPELFRANSGDWSFAYQGLAGVAWDISDHLSLDVTYRYVHASQSFDSKTTHTDNSPSGPVLQLGSFDRPYYDQSIVVGLRYSFGAPEPAPVPAPPEPPAPPAPPPIPAPPEQPAPPPAPVAKQFVVYFPFDQYVLTPEAQQVVQEAATYASSGNATRVMVVGHTDRSGSDKYNRRLSERRAKAVADAMVGMGVNSSTLAVDWKGESDNAVPTPDGVKEPLNRRATIDVNF